MDSESHQVCQVEVLIDAMMVTIIQICLVVLGKERTNLIIHNVANDMLNHLSGGVPYQTFSKGYRGFSKGNSKGISKGVSKGVPKGVSKGISKGILKGKW